MNQNNNEQPIQCESKKHLRKPEWIRIKLPCNNSATKMKNMLRSHHHHTVCEEAACPNQAECFNLGTATFLIMGGVCTRNCRFCNVKKGRPQPLNPNEPDEIARSVQEMQLKYVVITSVDRDDLADGGATHYLECMKKTRALNPHVKIEILVPDFKNCMDNALEILSKSPADVFNHNLETVPRLFKSITPGCSYELSLTVLQKHKERFPEIPTKSGLMLGLGETDDELIEVMQDLRQHNVDMLTLGQYLQPSRQHLPVDRYVPPEKFDEFAKIATKMGFSHVASGPLVRSSYHAEEQWTKKK